MKESKMKQNETDEYKKERNQWQGRLKIFPENKNVENRKR